MKFNQNTAIWHPPALLVPYGAHHVPTYHGWMQDPELRALTASEPQSLPAERAHQRAWREDPAKLTFIVCAADDGAPATGAEKEPPHEIRRGEHDAPARMLGDVNLFLSRASESDGGGEGSEEDAVVIGEVNIMVAVPAARGRGVGGAVLRALMWYVARSGAGLLREWIPDAHEQTRGVGRLVAKIDEGNGRSVELFRRAGFRMVSEAPNYFGEVEMAWEVEERAAGGDGGPQILEYVGGDYDAEEGQ